MAFNLEAFARDRGPWALLILIGGVILIGSLSWSPLQSVLESAGAKNVPDSGGGILSGFLLIAAGIGLFIWFKSRR